MACTYLEGREVVLANDKEENAGHVADGDGDHVYQPEGRRGKLLPDRKDGPKRLDVVVNQGEPVPAHEVKHEEKRVDPVERQGHQTELDVGRHHDAGVDHLTCEGGGERVRVGAQSVQWMIGRYAKRAMTTERLRVKACNG